jgi:hypothetical protein
LKNRRLWEVLASVKTITPSPTFHGDPQPSIVFKCSALTKSEGTLAHISIETRTTTM